jgi:hypothetical protein
MYESLPVARKRALRESADSRATRIEMLSVSHRVVVFAAADAAAANSRRYIILIKENIQT